MGSANRSVVKAQKSVQGTGRAIKRPTIRDMETSEGMNLNDVTQASHYSQFRDNEDMSRSVHSKASIQQREQKDAQALVNNRGPTMFTRVKDNKANKDAFYEDNYVQLNA